MRNLILAISTVSIVSTAALADPIADRKAIMKERGNLAGGLVAITKGEKPFDAAAVLTVLKGLQANSEKLNIDALFPAGSDKGDTAASPKIWEDMAGFKVAHEKEKVAVAAAVAAAPQNLDGLKVQLGKIGSACAGCHETFRLKKD